MTTVACEHCDAPNPAAGRFCRRCGKPLADPLVRSATRLSPLMEKWRKLSLQTTRKELRKLLGEPLRIEAMQAVERWTYEYECVKVGNGHCCGQVEISVDGRVVAWREPEWEKLQA